MADKNTEKDQKATEKKTNKKKVAVKKGTKPNPNTKKKVVAKKAAKKNEKAPAPEKTVEETNYEATAANAAEHLKQVAENAANVASGVTQSAADAANEAKDTIVDKAKAAYASVNTDEFHAVADKAQEKAADTARKAGQAVKEGLATHGIDADKLAGALKNDAKGAATAVLGGAKFVSERFSSFVSKMDAKVNSDKKDDDE